jgi:DNA-binding NarL/FixJ family response regulator
VTSLLRDDDRFTVVGDVASGAEVLARAPEADLVVLDLVLADIDAFSLIGQLQSTPRQPTAVIFTAVGPHYLRSQATAQGAAGYFTHDTDPAELLYGLVSAMQQCEPA